MVVNFEDFQKIDLRVGKMIRGEKMRKDNWQQMLIENQ